MSTVIVKNNTTSDVLIPDLGIVILASGQETLSDATFERVIGESSDLSELIAAGTLTINDGTLDLSLGTALTFLEDQKVGPEGDVLVWVSNGGVKVGQEIDGLRAVRRSGIIVSVIASMRERGKNGNTIIDLNRHTTIKPITTQRNDTVGVTVYTTQGNRAMIVGDNATKERNAIVEAMLPDVVDFSAGDFFTMDVDGVTLEAKDLVVQMFVRYK